MLNSIQPKLIRFNFFLPLKLSFEGFLFSMFINIVLGTIFILYYCCMDLGVFKHTFVGLLYTNYFIVQETESLDG